VGCLGSPGQRDPQLVERVEQVLRVAVDTECPGLGQFVLTVPATQKADAQHSGPARCEQVPDRVSDHIAVVAPHAHPLVPS